MKKIFLYSSILFLLSGSCAPKPITLDEIITKHTAALGGKDHLQKIHSYIKIRTPFMMSASMKPEYHLVELFREDSTFWYAEGYDGNTAWELYDDYDQKKVVTGEPATALEHTVQWPGNLRPLYTAPSRGHTLELAGEENLNGKAYYKLLMTLNDGFQRQYWINSETFMIEQAQDYRELHAYEENKRNLVTKWSDWRQVDGYWFAFRTEEWDIDTNEMVFGGTLLKIIVNPPIDRKRFGLSGIHPEYSDLLKFYSD